MSWLVYKMTIGKIQVNTDLCQVIYRSAAQCSRLHENIDKMLYFHAWPTHHNLVLF